VRAIRDGVGRASGSVSDTSGLLVSGVLWLHGGAIYPDTRTAMLAEAISNSGRSHYQELCTHLQWAWPAVRACAALLECAALHPGVG
jgi:hypothetical protein